MRKVTEKAVQAIINKECMTCSNTAVFVTKHITEFVNSKDVCKPYTQIDCTLHGNLIFRRRINLVDGITTDEFPYEGCYEMTNVTKERIHGIAHGP